MLDAAPVDAPAAQAEAGGRVEFGEGLKAAVAREVLEGRLEDASACATSMTSAVSRVRLTEDLRIAADIRGMVAQGAKILNLTVGENLELGAYLRRATVNRATHGTPEDHADRDPGVDLDTVQHHGVGDDPQDAVGRSRANSST